MKNIIKISVKNLIEFVLRAGNLISSFSAGGTERRIKAVQIHKKIENARAEEYIPEFHLSHSVELDNLIIEIQGIADGIYVYTDKIIVEEIKTISIPVQQIDENKNLLHWAQVKCYAFMYAALNNITNIEIQLTYYNIESKEIKTFTKQISINELKSFFYNILDKYYCWINLIQNWTDIRNNSIKNLNFPFKNYRIGQREFAVSVYRTIRDNKKLFVQAPTGTGKTISVLFPAIKSLNENHISKIFYLTAKTTNREIAEKSLNIMRDNGLCIKSTTITAKEKICFKSETECDPDYCEYAAGFFDRINNAVEDIFKSKNSFTRSIIEEYAEKYKVCPFEFSLELSLWSDCIICDYNYVFDPNVFLRRFFIEDNGDYTFLIDESHNLVDRAREMFSSELSKCTVLELKKRTKNDLSELSKSLNKLNSIFVKFRKQCQSTDKQFFIQKNFPKELINPLKNFCNKAEKYFLKNEKKSFHKEILNFYFEVIFFLKIIELYNERYITYFKTYKNNIKVKLFCVDPSYLLKEFSTRGKSVIFFSATLSPIEYFCEILGGNKEQDKKIILPAPFPKNNLFVMLADRIATKFIAREKTYDIIVEYISESIKHKIGNYLIYFPSYKYMQEIYNRFILTIPNINVLYQTQNMNESERENFIAQFKSDNTETLVGFAVMGGIFGESIDLIGDRLSGCVIIGVGLPQICLERDIIKDYFNNLNKKGFEYSYIYPGNIRVLQAAGRVIRSETDRGFILLIDERFVYSTYKNILPKEWFPIKIVRDKQHIKNFLNSFWQEK